MTFPVNEHTVLRTSAVVVTLASLALSFWKLAAGLSCFFGGAIGVLAFRHLTLDADKILRCPPGTAQRVARRGYFKRLLLYAAAITISLQSERFSFGWVFISLLIPKLMIYVLFLLRRIQRGS